MKRLSSFAVSSLLALIGIVSAWFALAEWFAENVRSSAETVANGDPYCVQVPGDGDYKEVTTLRNFSILSMRVGEGLASHHAVLAIDRGDEMGKRPPNTVVAIREFACHH